MHDYVQFDDPGTWSTENLLYDAGPVSAMPGHCVCDFDTGASDQCPPLSLHNLGTWAGAACPEPTSCTAFIAWCMRHPHVTDCGTRAFPCQTVLQRAVGGCHRWRGHVRSAKTPHDPHGWHLLQHQHTVGYSSWWWKFYWPAAPHHRAYGPPVGGAGLAGGAQRGRTANCQQPAAVTAIRVHPQRQAGPCSVATCVFGAAQAEQAPLRASTAQHTVLRQCRLGNLGRGKGPLPSALLLLAQGACCS